MPSICYAAVRAIFLNSPYENFFQIVPKSGRFVIIILMEGEGMFVTQDGSRKFSNSLTFCDMPYRRAPTHRQNFASESERKRAFSAHFRTFHVQSAIRNATLTPPPNPCKTLHFPGARTILVWLPDGSPSASRPIRIFNRLKFLESEHSQDFSQLL